MNVLDLDKIYDYYIKNFNLKCFIILCTRIMILSVRNFKDDVKKELEKNITLEQKQNV